MNRRGIPASLLARDERGRDAPPRPHAPGAPPGGSTRTGARRPGPLRRVVAWFEHHLQALFNTLGRMARTPLSTAMTAAVLGIALALPTGMFVTLQNVQAISASWDDTAQISLFLRKGVSAQAVGRLAQDIGAMEAVASVSHIPPAEGLEEFRRLSGFGGALDVLGENPLPSVLVVRPQAGHGTPERMEALLARLAAYDEVESALLDLEWIKRLYAITAIAERAALVLGLLLAFAVLLIIGNTIRLSIQSRREEIVVQKLIGATDAFVRRPFLYSGLLHGLFGAVFAWILVAAALWLLAGPVRRLAALYDSAFRLDGIGLATSVALLAGGVLLGLVGAWLAVGRHLRAIEPS